MDLLLSTWSEIAEAAAKALQSNDLDALQAVDAAVHHHLFAQLDAGDRNSRRQFVLDLGDLTESAPARAIPEPQGPALYLARWKHLAELANASADDVTAEEAARDFLKSRKHGDALLTCLAAAGPEGLRSGDLAQQLNLSDSHLANILSEFEDHDLIERRKAGKYVYVSVGLVGRLLQARKPMVISASPRWAKTNAPFEGMQPLTGVACMR